MLTVDLGTYKNNPYIDKYLFRKAIANVSVYPRNIPFQIMEDYINETFNLKTSLKTLCYAIINRSRISKSDDNYIITLASTDEDLYRLITYGNLEVKGLDILEKAFTGGNKSWQ